MDELQESVKKLLERLNQISYDIAADLETAAKAGAKSIRDEAKSRVPVKTGTLRDSITMETVEKDEDGVTIRIGPGKEGFYGLFLELGTSKMPARPWLVPAVKGKQQEALKAVEDALKKALNRLLR